MPGSTGDRLLAEESGLAAGGPDSDDDDGARPGCDDGDYDDGGYCDDGVGAPDDATDLVRAVCARYMRDLAPRAASARPDGPVPSTSHVTATDTAADVLATPKHNIPPFQGARIAVTHPPTDHQLPSQTTTSSAPTKGREFGAHPCASRLCDGDLRGGTCQPTLEVTATDADPADEHRRRASDADAPIMGAELLALSRAHAAYAA